LLVVPTPPPLRPRMHLDFLDGLRGLAALYVMVHHAWLTVWTDPRTIPGGLTGFFTNWLAFGHIAVTIFIVLSGFCLTIPVAQSGQLAGGALHFFKKRCRRILPPYYFALLLSCILILTVIGKPTGTHWDVAIPNDLHSWIKSLIAHVLLVEDVVDSYLLNHVLWSVSVEWHIYFLFPLLVILFYRRWNPHVTTLVTMAVAYAVAMMSASTHLGRANPQYVGMFVLGMYSATVAFSPQNTFAKLREIFPWRAVGLLLAAGAIASMIAMGLRNTVLALSWFDLPVGLCTACVLIVATTRPTGLARSILSWSPLVWVGTFSYSLYLIHAPLIQVVWQYALRPLNLSPAATFAWLATAGGTFIVLASYMFYLACERPFLNTPPKTRRP